MAMAAALGLGIDESYMVAAGRTIRWGYFDHPPLAWWLSAGAARLFGTEAGWAVRLPFIALFGLTTWFIFRLGALVSPAAGFWGALTLNLAPVLGLAAGGWVLPDGPLDCALAALAVCLTRALPSASGWRWWGAAGIAAGLALLSKYTAILPLAGMVVYLLSQPDHRRWLGRPQPYGAALIAAGLFTPVLAWNAAHGWISFAFQGGRAGANGLHLAGPLVTLGGEALFLIPWIWAGLAWALWRAWRAGPPAWPSWLLFWLAIGPVALFAVVSLWSRHVLYHWAGPGYLLAFPLLGAVIAGRDWARRATVATAVIVCLGMGVVAAEARWNWLARIWPGADPARQAVDWSPLRDVLRSRGLLDRPGTALAATSWAETGKLDYAVGADGPRVVCLSTDARQYGLLPGPETMIGGDLLIVAARDSSAHLVETWTPMFDGIEPLPPAEIAPPGRPPIEVALALGHRLRRWPPS